MRLIETKYLSSLRWISFRMKPERLFRKKEAMKIFFVEIRISWPKLAEGKHQTLWFMWVFELCKFQFYKFWYESLIGNSNGPMNLTGFSSYRSCNYMSSTVIFIFWNFLFKAWRIMSCTWKTQSIQVSPKADLGLLQHPRWSSLW